MPFTLGSDPEMMIVDTQGNYKSAIGIVQAHSELRIKKKGHEFYYDNVLAECAIKPSSSAEEAVHNFRECLGIYKDMVAPYILLPQASQNYPQEELQHEDARKVNCAPEFCPYDMRQTDGPVNEIKSGTLRTCGGHVHLGHEDLNEEKGFLSMFIMDLLLGVPALWLDQDPTSATRRRMYGAPGRYRVKDYGMEYRAISNFWLSSPALVEFVFNLSKFATEFVVNGDADEHWTFNLDVFYENPRQAWTCHTYDVGNLRCGIQNSDKKLVEPHFQLAQSLMPKPLKEKMLELCSYKPKPFYEEWKI